MFKHLMILPLIWAIMGLIFGKAFATITCLLAGFLVCVIILYGGKDA